MDVRVGFHVSIAGGISNSVNNAKKLGCTAFQIFSRNPRGWAAKPLLREEVDSFKNRLCESGIEKTAVVVHMPYLPNLSGPPGELYERSVKTLIEEMQRCNLLGISYLVIHLGSHMGGGSNSGIDQLVNALTVASAGSKSENKWLVSLEIMWDRRIVLVAHLKSCASSSIGSIAQSNLAFVLIPAIFLRLAMTYAQRRM